MVEAPGTAPGSETLMSRGVYRHSRLPDVIYIDALAGVLKVPRLSEFRILSCICHPWHRLLRSIRALDSGKGTEREDDENHGDTGA